MNKEIAIALKCIASGKEIPESIKATALEEINLRSMLAEDEATEYIFNKLYEAIDHEDSEAITFVADIIEASYPELAKEADRRPANRVALNPEDVEAFAQLSSVAVDEFCGEDGPEAMAKVHILAKLQQELDLFPVKFIDDLLVMLTFDLEHIVVFQCRDGVSKVDTARQFADVDKDDVYVKLREVKGAGSTDVNFLRLRWRLINNNSLEVMTLPLEEV